MTAQPTQTAPPILRTAVVARPVTEAFTIFTDEIGAWWPLPTHSVFQGQAGGVHFIDGKLIERATDGRQTTWAEVLAWEPPNRLVLSWFPGRQPEAGGGEGSGRVEVTFAEAEGGTRVDIRHDGWEAFGADALRRRRDYLGPSAWGHVLDHFADGAELRHDPEPDPDPDAAGDAPLGIDGLAAAYEEFFAEAEAGAAAGDFGPPDDGGWTAEQVIAHVALNDLALTAVAHALVHRSEPTFENHTCQAIETLDAVVAEHGDLAALIANGRRCATQALAAARRLDPEQRAKLVECTFEHDGQVVFDGLMPWGQVAIETQAGRHLPAHVEQLQKLRRR
ncbi:MAG: SRPBCC domain-containing protein [Actinomycetota bacterium]